MKRSLALGRAAGFGAIGLLFSLAAGAQVLEIAAIYQNTFGGVNGIRGNRSVIVSDDGLFAYATGEGDSSVVAFSRDPSNGFLTQIQQLKNAVDGIDGLRGANTVRLSPNGKNLYATGFFGDALAVFSRDETTGLLTEIQVLKDNTPEVPDGLDGPLWIAVSDDGKNLYTTGFFDDSVVVFDRDRNTGTLTYRQLLKDGVGGVNGLNGAYAMWMDSKSKYIYVGGLDDNAVSVFRRGSHGSLSQVQQVTQGVDGVSGITGVRGLVGDKRGDHLYAVSLDDSAISTFDIRNGHGTLTQTQVIRDTDAGIDGLGGATGINITPDGRYVIATGFLERKMSVWAVDRGDDDDDDDSHEGDAYQANDDHHGTGQLSLVQVLANLVDTPFGLNGPIDLNSSRDGCYVYSSSYNVHIILQWHVINCVPGGDDDDDEEEDD